MNKKAINKKSFLATPYFFWMVGFTILPLIMICYYAFTSAEGMFTLDNFTVLAKKMYLDSFILSLKLALFTTFATLIMSYPLAIILRKYNLGKKGMIICLFILPMWMNFILRIMAWQLLLSKNGIINTILSALSLPTLNIINTPVAVCLGMIYDYLPFMLLPIYNSVVRIDSSIIEAAQDLGANESCVFFKIILPNTISGAVSGITMVFVPSMTSFVVADMLGGGKVMLIGNIIEQQFSTTYNWNLGSSLSFMLMIFIMLSMLIFNFVDKDSEGGAASIW